MPRLAKSHIPPVEKAPATRDKLRKSLLSWYDRHGRALPWRTKRPDPYRVWLSEVMLQQTGVATVIPYYRRFLALWPKVGVLAAAERTEVLTAWAGLGYYARARNLHAAAQILAKSGFPETEAGWRALPGVGVYTAAAIAAIANNEAANVVDGNVERVMARLYAEKTPLPEAKSLLRALAGALVTEVRPGDWAQALMDLGATVCTPQSPDCASCPVRRFCLAHATGRAEAYPYRRPKPVKPFRYGVVFVACREGRFWQERRGENGLLAGMAGLPTTEWRARRWGAREALAQAPSAGAWRRLGEVRHAFTHFALTLEVYSGGRPPSAGGWWGDASALPTVFRKAAALALK